MIRHTAMLSVLVFAAVVGSVFALALPSAAACQQWVVPREFWGSQSNGWAVKFLLQQNGQSLQGTAESALFAQRQYIKNRGSADGSITSSRFQVTVYWRNSKAV